MSKRRKRQVRAPPVEPSRTRRALPARLRGTQKGTTKAFVRHALGTAGLRSQSKTPFSTDLKSAGRKTVGVQVSLPPSLKRLAAAGLAGVHPALRSDSSRGLRGGENPGRWWWPLTPMAAGWAASSWRRNAMATRSWSVGTTEGRGNAHVFRALNPPC